MSSDPQAIAREIAERIVDDSAEWDDATSIIAAALAAAEARGAAQQAECVWCEHVTNGRRAHCPTHGFAAASPSPDSTRGRAAQHEEIRERLSKITPGKWSAKRFGDSSSPPPEYRIHAEGTAWPRAWCYHDNESDVEFIANAPADLAFLLAENDRLTKDAQTAEARGRAAQQADLERKYRALLWRGHGHNEASYGDDGEMQCGKCRQWDYLRAPLEELEQQIFQLKLDAMAKAQAQPSPSPDVTRGRAAQEELDAIKAARAAVHARFRGQRNAAGDCTCPYCTRDAEALAEMSAEYEMDLHNEKQKREALEQQLLTAESRGRAAGLREAADIALRLRDEIYPKGGVPFFGPLDQLLIRLRTLASEADQ